MSPIDYFPEDSGGISTCAISGDDAGPFHLQMLQKPPAFYFDKFVIQLSSLQNFAYEFA